MAKIFEISANHERCANGFYRPIIEEIYGDGESRIHWTGKARFKTWEEAVAEAELEFELQTKPD